MLQLDYYSPIIYEYADKLRKLNANLIKKFEQRMNQDIHDNFDDDRDYWFDKADDTLPLYKRLRDTIETINDTIEMIEGDVFSKTKEGFELQYGRRE